MTSAVHSAVHCQVAECPQCESFAIMQLERMVINNAVVSSKASVTFHLALLVVTDLITCPMSVTKAQSVQKILSNIE